MGGVLERGVLDGGCTGLSTPLFARAISKGGQMMNNESNESKGATGQIPRLPP